MENIENYQKGSVKNNVVMCVSFFIIAPILWGLFWLIVAPLWIILGSTLIYFFTFFSKSIDPFKPLWDISSMWSSYVYTTIHILLDLKEWVFSNRKRALVFTVAMMGIITFMFFNCDRLFAQETCLPSASITILDVDGNTILGSDDFEVVLTTPNGMSLPKEFVPIELFNSIDIYEGHNTFTVKLLKRAYPEIVPGDADGNGKVGIEDAILILRMLADGGGVE